MVSSTLPIFLYSVQHETFETRLCYQQAYQICLFFSIENN